MFYTSICANIFVCLVLYTVFNEVGRQYPYFEVQKEVLLLFPESRSREQ